MWEAISQSNLGMARVLLYCFFFTVLILCLIFLGPLLFIFTSLFDTNRCRIPEQEEITATNLNVDEEEEIKEDINDNDGILPPQQEQQQKKKKRNKGGKRKKKIAEYPHIPESIILVHILSRLPVKSLMRCRYVCKSWNSYLNKNPSFISLHMSNYYNSDVRSCNNMLIFLKDEACHITSISVVSFLNKLNAVYEDTLRVRDLDISNIPNDKFVPSDIIGCCNGIICMEDIDEHEVALWNPVTRDFKIIPPSFSFSPYGYERNSNGELRLIDDEFLGYTLRYCRGFGFDSINNDYKILEMFNYYRQGTFGTLTVTHVGVYTLSTNSWRVLDDDDDGRFSIRSILSLPCKNNRYLLTTSYSLADGCCRFTLFDTSEELFHIIRLPADVIRNRALKTVPWYDQSIALIEDTHDQPHKGCNVWVTKEFGVEDSWTQVASYGPLPLRNTLLGFWKNGEILFATHKSSVRGKGYIGHLSTYNNLGRHLGINISSDCLIIYKESLVSFG